MAVALAFAAGVVALGLLTGAAQVRGLRRLAARAHVPSDERAYLRARFRRRLLTAGVLVVIGLMIGGAYLSGLERATDALAAAPGADPDTPKPEMTPEQKDQFRVWVFYWTGIVVLAFALTGLAFLDALATRRYWLVVYKELRDDHQQRLRRDLAVYKQQVNETRNGRFKPNG